MSARQRTANVNGVEFAYLQAGPSEGPLALCLHGFPDTAHTWRHLLPALAGAGYRAVAPWMRGYAPTQVPADGAYGLGALASDACALHDALGGDADAVLVGHDWGSGAALAAGAWQPERWRRLVVLAVPPQGAITSRFFCYDQLKRSFYMFLFQTPLAEMALSVDDRFIDRLWADWSPGYDGAWDVARVKESLGAPANMAAALGYYRAMFDPAPPPPAYAEAQRATADQPRQPLLYLHGEDDGCLGIDVVGDVLPHVGPGSKQVTVPHAGHFLHVEKPDEVNAHVLAFLGG